MDAELRDGMRGPDDGRGAVLTFHALAGGGEARDWARMLVQMYQRWAERHGLHAKLLDVWLASDHQGVEQASMAIDGPYVYGRLRGEDGVHRLVRVSPFDSAGRRHVAFARVTVQPLPEGGDPADLPDATGSDEQIRTYVFHPYTKVSDARTGLELADADGVMDGDLDALITAYLRV